MYELENKTRRMLCRNGHEFNPENTKIEMIGMRQVKRCIICTNAREAKKHKVCPGVTIEMLERKRELAAVVVKTQSDTARAEWRELTDRINAARAAVGGAA